MRIYKFVIVLSLIGTFVPSSSAGLMESFAVCDVMIAPTKCVAAAADTVATCADASFEGPFGGQHDVNFCVNVTGAAAASAIIHVPVGQHHDTAVAGTVRKACGNTYQNILGSSACGAVAFSSDCGIEATGNGGATNFAPITTGDASAHAAPCPVKPPPAPGPASCAQDPDPIRCFKTCSQNRDRGLNFSEIRDELLQNIPEPIPPNPIGCTSQQASTQPLGSFSPEIQEQIRAAVADAALAKLETRTSSWPQDELHTLLKAALHDAYVDAAGSLDPLTLVETTELS